MLAANGVMIVLRALHIVFGALWVGSAFLFVAIIGPSAAEVGPSAGPLLAVVVKKKKAVIIIDALAGITVLAGWLMWLKDGSDFASYGDWVTSSFGFALTLGAIAASVTMFVGLFGVGRNVERMVDLGGEIAAGGGPPTPEQQARMDALGAATKKFGQIDLALLLFAVVMMSTARYW